VNLCLKKRFFLSLLLLLVVGFHLPHVRADENILSEKAILTEAPKQWNKYQALLLDKQGASISIKDIEKGTYKGKAHSTENDALLSFNNNFGALIKRFPANNKIGIWGLNSDYSFKIFQDDSESEWQIISVKQHPADLDMLTTKKRIEGNGPLFNARVALVSGLTIGNIKIDDLFLEKSFRVKSIQEKIVDGKSLVKLKFEFSPENLSGPYVAERSGTLWLNPSSYWLLEKAIIQCEYTKWP
jgi:hypothetical protein